MKSIRRPLVLAAVLAALAGGTMAQTAATATPPAATADAHPHRHGHGRMDPAKWQERFNRRMATLKQKLQITTAQESAWTAYTHALQPRTKGPRPDRQALAQMTTPQRLDHLRGLREQRMAAMDRRAEATKAFYGALTSEQQKTFDELTVRRFKRGHHHRG